MHIASWSQRLLTIGLAVLFALPFVGCKGDDNNGNPGLLPFQLPINTGQPGRTDPVLTSLRLEPGGGLNLQVGTGVDVKAIGTFSDGAVADLSGFAIWKQSNPGVGSLTGAGKFVAQNSGQTTIFARIDQVQSDGLFVFAANLITSNPSAVQGLGGTILPGQRFRLTWSANPEEENVIGYVIYRSRVSADFEFKTDDDDPDSPNFIQDEPQVGLLFTDETAVGGVVYYVVQAVRRDINDPDVLIYGAPSRQLKVNFATGQIGEKDN